MLFVFHENYYLQIWVYVGNNNKTKFIYQNLNAPSLIKDSQKETCYNNNVVYYQQCTELS